MATRRKKLASQREHNYTIKSVDFAERPTFYVNVTHVQVTTWDARIAFGLAHLPFGEEDLSESVIEPVVSIHLGKEQAWVLAQILRRSLIENAARGGGLPRYSASTLEYLGLEEEYERDSAAVDELIVEDDNDAK